MSHEHKVDAISSITNCQMVQRADAGQCLFANLDGDPAGFLRVNLDRYAVVPIEYLPDGWYDYAVAAYRSHLAKFHETEQVTIRAVEFGADVSCDPAANT